MTKYEELKERIEKLTYWDEEANKLLRLVQDKIHFNHIGVFMHSQSYLDEYGGNWGYIEITDGVSQQRYFYKQFDSDYSVLRAFKDALLYLLDKSHWKREHDKQNLLGQVKKVEIDGKVYKVKILEEVKKE